MSKDELLNKIATYTGGRAAEELVFHSITTGASNDIEQATKLARSMISRFGMSDEFGFVAFETVSNQYLGGDAALACSPETQARIDRKVTEMVDTQYQKAMDLLKTNEEKLHQLAQYLYEHETITGREFMEILEDSGRSDRRPSPSLQGPPRQGPKIFLDKPGLRAHNTVAKDRGPAAAGREEGR